jgi:hypothetical protein
MGWRRCTATSDHQHRSWHCPFPNPKWSGVEKHLSNGKAFLPTLRLGRAWLCGRESWLSDSNILPAQGERCQTWKQIWRDRRTLSFCATYASSIQEQHVILRGPRVRLNSRELNQRSLYWCGLRSVMSRAVRSQSLAP